MRKVGCAYVVRPCLARRLGRDVDAALAIGRHVVCPRGQRADDVDHAIRGDPRDATGARQTPDDDLVEHPVAVLDHDARRDGRA